MWCPRCLRCLTKIFRLHHITMYFADITFLNKEWVTTQAFAFSKFKSKHLNRQHNCHVTFIGITDKTQNEDRAWYLSFHHVLQLLNLVRLVGITKNSYRWPCHDCLVTYVQFTEHTYWTYKHTGSLQHSSKSLYSKGTIFLFHIKYKVLQFIHKTVDDN